MKQHKTLFTILYGFYILLILLTPTKFYEGTAAANVIVKVFAIILPYMVYMLDGETYIASLADIRSVLSNAKPLNIVTKLQESGIKFPIECLSVLKSFPYKFDSPNTMRNVSNKIRTFANTRKINLKPIRQSHGLRVNSYVYSVEEFITETKTGIQKSEVPNNRKLAELSKELKRILGGRHEVEYDLVPGSQYIQFITAATKQNKAGLGNVLRSPQYAKMVNTNKHGQVLNLPVGLGVDLQGNPSVVDLQKFPHGRVLGATLSGKSSGITTILTSLFSLITPRELEVNVIDLKQVDYVAFEDFPHIRNFITEKNGVIEVLNNITTTMNERYTLLKANKVQNTIQYNMKVRNPELFIPNIILMIDEYVELLLSSENSKDLIKFIVQLCSMGRAAGINVLLSSQRMDSGNTHTLIKANTDAVLGFKTVTASDSRVAIDQNGCEKLLGEGDCLVKYQGNISRVQFCLVSQDEINRLSKMWSKYDA